MNIIQAASSDIEQIEFIARQTISQIYPHYYPCGAVEFFLAHHNAEKISADINAGVVFTAEYNGTLVGTVTVKQNEILRLFVLPEYQGRGIGRAMLDFAERRISSHYDKITLSASLPAKGIYLRRGYRETAFDRIITPNGDFLCYDTMEKLSVK